jgi:anti-sigma regulatory factor (Ser/Thr protein kinase)
VLVDSEVYIVATGMPMSVIDQAATSIAAGAVHPFPALLEAAPEAIVIVDDAGLILLCAGRTGVLVGDVTGRGLKAAAVIGRLRSAANALARTGIPPAPLIHALDLVARDIPEQLMTCCYLIIDSQTGELTGCPAGHLPVLLTESDGNVRELRIPVSDPFDDITLLLTRIPDRPLLVVTSTMGPQPRSAGSARATVRDTLARWGHQDLADTACLLVTEILTNAIRHARCPIRMHLCRAAEEVIVEITDDSPEFPQRRLPDDDDEGGRGLLLVDALADGWGARPAVPGKTVWFTLRIPPDGR